VCVHMEEGDGNGDGDGEGEDGGVALVMLVTAGAHVFTERNSTGRGDLRIMQPSAITTDLGRRSAK